MSPSEKAYLKAEQKAFVKDQGCSKDDKFCFKKLITGKHKQKVIVPRQPVKIKKTTSHRVRVFMRKTNPKPFIAKKVHNMKLKVVDRVNSVSEKIHDKFTDIAFEVQMMSLENPFSRDFYEDHCTIL